MANQIKAIYDWIMSRDWFTWVGHAILGGLIYLVFRDIAVVFVAFFYRELSDLLAWWRDPSPVWNTEGEPKPPYKPNLHAKLFDGFLDLWSPLAGSAVVAILLDLL